MKEDSIIRYINAHQLSSVMNKTKWRELANEITSNSDFYPEIRIKHVWDEGPDFIDGKPDWELIKFGGAGRYIEWMDIDPIKRRRVERLVEDTTNDFSTWVRQALEKHSIPFQEEGRVFRVYGYLRPQSK